MAAGVEVGVGVVRLEPKPFDGAKVGQQLADDVTRSANRELAGARGGFVRAGEGAADGFGDGFKREATSQVGAGMDAAAAKVKEKGLGLGKLIGGLGLGLAAGKLFDFGKDAFQLASDLNEAQSKSDTVFGAWAQQMTDFADGSAKNFGLSKAAALDAAATFGNLFTAMGLSQQQSADMSSSILQLAGDLASFNNVPVEDALQALQSGLVGENEPLRRFGVNINDARLKAEALRLGLVHGNVSMVDVQAKAIAVSKAQAAAAKATKEHGANSLEAVDANNKLAKAQEDLEEITNKVPDDLTAAQKAQASYSLIMQDTSTAQGDYARTAEGAANKTKTLGSEWDNFKAKLGTKLLPIGIGVFDAVETGLNSVSSWIDENGPGIQQWFDDTFGPDKMESFKNGIREIFDIPQGADITDTLRADLAAGAAEIEPIFVSIGEHLVALKDGFIDPIFGTMQRLVPAIGEELGMVVEMVEVSFGFLVSKVFDPLFGTLESIDSFVNDTLNKTFNAFKEDILDPIFGTVQSIVDYLSKLSDNPIGTLASTLHDLGIPGFGGGGVVPGQIGKPRLIMAHAGETVLPTHQLEFASARGLQLAAVATAPVATSGQTFGDINVTGVTQPWETAYAVRDVLRARQALAGGR